MSKVKIGVVGCGAIALVHHIPWLTELSEESILADLALLKAEPEKSVVDPEKSNNSEPERSKVTSIVSRSIAELPEKSLTDT